MQAPPSSLATAASPTKDGRWIASLIATALGMLALGFSLGSGGEVPQSDARVLPQPAGPTAPSAPLVTEPPALQPVPIAAAPAPSQASEAPGTPDAPRLLVRRVNINTATSAELELLPGVGPAMAARIIEHRRTKGPFRGRADFDSVRGIGEKTLERLLPLIEFGETAAPPNPPAR